MEYLRGKQLKKLGKRLRDAETPDAKDLEQLQQYRHSYKDVVAEIFSVISNCAKPICPDVISAFRIKRIDSIIGKLRRLRGRLELDSMVDIAGCRFIVNKDSEIYKIVDLLHDTPLVITRVNRNIGNNPKETGYKSVHIHAYLEKYGEDRPVEIQLRTHIHHNWATFVETIDLLYGLRIKEGVKDEKTGEMYDDFYRFHQIMSKSDAKKSQDEKLYLLDKIVKYDVIGGLNHIILKNVARVRLQWLQLKHPSNNSPTCYVISTRKDKEPEILGFTSFEKAEEKYYQLFSTNTDNANIVLLNMPDATYEQLTVAYSNYLLVGHEFMHSFNQLTIEMFDLSSDLLTEQLKPYFDYYNRALKCYNMYIHQEHLLLLNGMRNFPAQIQQEWRNDVERRYKELYDDNMRFQQELYHRYLYEQQHSAIGKFLLKLRLKYFR